MSWENHVCENGHEARPMDRLRSWEADGVVFVELRCPECETAYTADSNGGRS